MSKAKTERVGMRWPPRADRRRSYSQAGRIYLRHFSGHYGYGGHGKGTGVYVRNAALFIEAPLSGRKDRLTRSTAAPGRLRLNSAISLMKFNNQEKNMVKKLCFILVISLLASTLFWRPLFQAATTPPQPRLPPERRQHKQRYRQCGLHLKLSNGTVYQTTVGTGYHSSLNWEWPGDCRFDAAVKYDNRANQNSEIAAKDAYGTQKSASNQLAVRIWHLYNTAWDTISLSRSGFTVQVDYTLKLPTAQCIKQPSIPTSLLCLRSVRVRLLPVLMMLSPVWTWRD